MYLQYLYINIYLFFTFKASLPLNSLEAIGGLPYTVDKEEANNNRKQKTSSPPRPHQHAESGLLKNRSPPPSVGDRPALKSGTQEKSPGPSASRREKRSPTVPSFPTVTLTEKRSSSAQSGPSLKLTEKRSPSVQSVGSTEKRSSSAQSAARLSSPGAKRSPPPSLADKTSTSPRSSSLGYSRYWKSIRE